MSADVGLKLYRRLAVTNFGRFATGRGPLALDALASLDHARVAADVVATRKNQTRSIHALPAPPIT
jgi:hypothetical protein